MRSTRDYFDIGRGQLWDACQVQVLLHLDSELALLRLEALVVFPEPESHETL